MNCNRSAPSRAPLLPGFHQHRNLSRRRLGRLAAISALAIAHLLGWSPRAGVAAEAEDAAPGSEADNSACFVCHVNYKEEPLTRVHARAEVGCADCHGKSREHADDEANTTPPTTLYPADKIDAACTRCHPTHTASARAVINSWLERRAGKTSAADVVCTDCHGKHRLPVRSIVWDKQTGKLLVKHQPIARQATEMQAEVRPVLTGLFARSNLVAWCIVPFDARKRGPEERAAMLEWLGFQMLAYDYRAEHIPTFDEEMKMLKRYHVRLLAWWFPGVLNDEAKLVLDVLKRHGLRDVQLWITGGGEPVKDRAEQQRRVEAEAERIQPIAEAAAQQDCTVALYNHGAWFGEPENQIAIIERLKQAGISNVGIVYNLHHGHEHLDRFPELMARMKPYLMTLNLNGMVRDGDKTGKKILPLGQGDLDLELLRTIRDSGWQGPIGILNHTGEDAEARLQDNLDGLDWLVARLDGKSAGSRPTPSTWPETGGLAVVGGTTAQGRPSLAPAFGKALSGGWVVEGKPDHRNLPITVECWAKLDGPQGFNILVASDTKASAEHWELYSFAGSGVFSVYQPGRGGDFGTSVDITDGQWHYLAAILEPQRVRLYVDGELALDKPATPVTGTAQPGGLAFGQLVEGGIGCDGMVDEVRISRGVREITGVPKAPFPVDARTIGRWSFDELSSDATAVLK